jgi:hypothetical protein
MIELFVSPDLVINHVLPLFLALREGFQHDNSFAPLLPTLGEGVGGDEGR